MILDLDIGNTRLKWRIAGNESQASAISLGELGTLAEQLQGSGISRVRASCVAGNEAQHRLREWCEQHFDVQPEFAQVKQGVAGLTVAYQDVNKLGVDRWLALLAAYQQARRACVVIDAGSALTVDFVDGQGVHLGGLILPGVRTMGKALFSQTHGVKVDALTVPQNWGPGRDTVACVENAVAAALKGLLNEVLQYAHAHCGKGFSVLACGGDASVIAGYQPAVIVMPDLVLDGLPIASEHT